MAPTAPRAKNALTLCRASAGTGKTTSICDVIVEHIVHRELDPALILATTFTLRAAAELEERIHARLMSETSITPDKRSKLAERLELARIGTIDAVAFQIVERYALELGLSPDVQVADEVASRRTLERLVSEVDADEWEALHRAAEPLDVGDLTDVILELLELQRANGIAPKEARAQLLNSADRLIEILAPEGPADGLQNAPDLGALARTIHDEIEALGDSTKVTAKAQAELRKLANASTPTWAALMRVSKLGAGKKSGADKLLAPLRAAVGVVRRHPLLHRDLREFLTRCADVTEKLGERYQRTKAERGLVDFRDLELEMLKLLARPETAEQIASEVRLFVVDEFQDTDPLQLALFLELQRLVPHSYWVGDEKQAIYGFRGTDARLTRAVWESAEPGANSDWAHAPELRTLDTSYRSLPLLVDTVGELFTDALGDSVVVKCGRGRPADADANDPAATGVLERWELDASRREDEFELLADGVSELLADQPATDDTSMAVLVRSHKEARTIGRLLGDRGVPSVLELPGVTRTRTSVAALAALQLLADPWDSAAAATLIHHVEEDDVDRAEPTPAWFESRLREVNATESGAPFAGHPLVDAVDRLRERIRTHSPAEALAEVVEAVGLPTKIASWGDALRRASDLDALHQLAAEYEEHQHDAGEAISIPGMIRHLERLRDAEEDSIVPPLTRGAVHVVTYHAAKGLQWSTVILGSLDWEGSTNLWKPEVIGAVDIAGGQPLADRQLRYWPWPFGVSSRSRFKRASADGFEKEALDTPEGRAAVREQLDESIRLLYVGATRARDRLIFAHRPESARWLGRLRHAEEVLGRRLSAVKRFERKRTATPDAADRGRELTFASTSAPGDEPPEAWHSPSGTTQTQRGDDAKIACVVTPIDGRSPESKGSASDAIPSVLHEERDRVGNALHAYFATLPASASLTDADRRVAAERCLTAHLDSDCAAAEGLTPDALVRWGEQLRGWVDARYPNARWYPETPISGVRSEGGHWVGVADLILETDDGRTVVIDHKSAAVTASGAESVARHYAAQLDAYRAALSAGDNSGEIETWIYLPRAECLVELQPAPAAPSSTPRSWVQSELF